MAINVPDNPKVYTTKYDNFKGVDFTNDSTNVWHRRSPTGVNMLPDASGRPFKRHGWEILLSNAELCEILGVENCTITKCTWFELAGRDHIVIFTDRGVIFYNGEVTATSTDATCFTSYDRCFFFEGNGTSAFYIYGGYKIWRYSYEDEEYVFDDVTDEATIPRVVVGASADGTGTVYEGYNLLTNMASVEYSDNNLLTYYGTDGLVFKFNEQNWKANTTDYVFNSPQTYWWKYNGSTWEWNADYTPPRGEPPFPYDPEHSDQSAIIPVNPKNGDEIVVLYGAGLMLPTNLDINTQLDDIKVYVTNREQFDTEIPVVDLAHYASGTSLLVMDVLDREHRQAHVEFMIGDDYITGNEPPFKGMDTFKVVFPATEVVLDDVPVAEDEYSVELVGTRVGE